MMSRQALSRAARRVAAVPRVVVPPMSSVPSRMYVADAAAPPPPERTIKPPIALFGLDGTYATALYTAAVKTTTLDQTARALGALGRLLQQDPKLLTILSMPTLSAADRASVAAELQRSAGASSDMVKNLLAVLADNNRLGLLGSVCDNFAQLMSAAHGEVGMKVTSAQPLDPRTLSRLESAVAKSAFVGDGKKLKVNNEVDPDIVGGLVVEIGDRTIDLSVSAKMAKMNKLLADSL